MHVSFPTTAERGLAAGHAEPLARIADTPALASLAGALALAPEMSSGVLASVPTALEDTTEVLSGVARDLYSYVPKLAYTAAAAGARRVADIRHPVARRAAFRRATIAQRTDQVHGALSQFLAEHHPEDREAWDRSKPQLLDIFTRYPRLLAHAENTTGNSVASAIRWPVITRAPRAMITAGLLQAAQAHTITALSDGNLSVFDEDSAQSLDAQLDVAGTMPMWIARGISHGLQRFTPFRNSVIDAALLQAFLESGKLPKTELPSRLALLTPGEENVDLHVEGPFDWRTLHRESHVAHTVTLPFQVQATDPHVRMFLAATMAGQPRTEALSAMFARPTRIVLRVRDRDAFADVVEKVVRLASIDALALPKGAREVDASNLYALTHSILRHGAAGLGPRAVVDHMPLLTFLETCDIMQVVSDNPAVETYFNETRMQSGEPHIRRLRAALVLLEIQKLHYFDRADLKEAAGDLIKGATIGSVYELASEFAFPSTGKPFYADGLWYLNIAGVTAIEYIDSRLGRRAAAKLALASKGKRITDQALYGPHAERASVWEKTTRGALLTMRGVPPDDTGVSTGTEAGIPATGMVMRRHSSGMALSDITPSTRAAPQQQDPTPQAQEHGAKPRYPDRDVMRAVVSADRASVLGTATGLLLQIPAMIPISNLTAPVWQLMVGSAFSTVGTSLSIPFDVVDQVLRKLRAHRALYDRGILREPTDDARNANKMYVKMLDAAIRDITLSIEGQSSITAFTLAPSIALLWLFMYINPAARTILQPIIFGLGPGFENLMMLVMAKLVKSGFDTAGSTYETVAYAEAITSALRSDAAADLAIEPTVEFAQAYRDATAHHWSIVAAQMMVRGAYVINLLKMWSPLSLRRSLKEAVYAGSVVVALDEEESVEEGLVSRE